MVGASNEMPESEELEALFDRFLIRRWIVGVLAALGALLRTSQFTAPASCFCLGRFYFPGPAVSHGTGLLNLSGILLTHAALSSRSRQCGTRCTGFSHLLHQRCVMLTVPACNTQRLF
eukprot:gene3231-biopygen3175